ncbi:MAG: SIS domain-containing protein [Endomicrobium sp.]|jgi:D-sedoheptulose 7-phosphate isomerase|nr:SIS domain-containing protein [Endomicrobium sp.]
MIFKKHISCIYDISNKIIEVYKNKKKIMLCGNGGSSSDALHFASEMIVKFEKERIPLPSIVLSSNISTITAIGNDIGFNYLFSRQVEAFSQKGDILIAISTSGKSKNILQALKSAKRKKIFTIGMTGENGKNMENICNLCYKAPSKITARIQECHILIIHIIAKIIDKHFSKIS